jgi:hypothetical protein
MLGHRKELIDYLITQNDETIFELKEKKEKRTLTMNSYYWALTNQVALTLELPPEEIHKDNIYNYATSELVVVRYEIDVSNIFKYYKFIRKTKINGENFAIYKVYVGSSKMSKKEFSRLLDGIIQECEQLRIPTLTKNEMEKLNYIEMEM